MSIIRKYWTGTEDFYLAGKVLESISNGNTLLNAFKEAATYLNTNVNECEFRWNAVLADYYSMPLAHAKYQRKLKL
ncbi:hypothetical protein [Priestia flexa]|uniref:hypothetical protein n=1 Tax=Priestia flexa TaxID=86664 RepID=UPI000473F517|nr:hypothetical protein [Priestia flexa]